MNVTPVEEKTLDDEPIVYATKQVLTLKYFVNVFYSWIGIYRSVFSGGKKCI